MLDSDLVARRLAPCRMVFCASPDFLNRHGTPRNVEELRRAPRLAFSEAVSAGDWMLTDPEGQSHLSACVGCVVYSAGLICTGITRGLTSVVRVKASAIAATSAPSSGSC